MPLGGTVGINTKFCNDGETLESRPFHAKDSYSPFFSHSQVVLNYSQADGRSGNNVGMTKCMSVWEYKQERQRDDRTWDRVASAERVARLIENYSPSSCFPCNSLYQLQTRFGQFYHGLCQVWVRYWFMQITRWQNDILLFLLVLNY